MKESRKRKIKSSLLGLATILVGAGIDYAQGGGFGPEGVAISTVLGTVLGTLFHRREKKKAIREGREDD